MNASRLLFAILASALLVRGADTAPIDLPTTLRLAGAKAIEVELARERLAESRAAADATRARYYPWLTPAITVRNHLGNVQAVNGPILDADKNSLTAGVVLGAQIDLGEAYYQNLAARQSVRAATATLAGRQRETTFRAVSAYFDLVRSRAAVVTSEEALRVAHSHVTQIEATTAAGLTFAGDAARVRSARDRAALTLSRAQSEQRLAAARLAELLRLDPAVELTPPDLELAPTNLSAPGDLGPLIAKAVATRPELDEAAARQESARLSQRAATRGAWMPSVGAQVGVGGLGGGPRGSTLGRDFDTSVDTAFGLSWRIGPGGLFDDNRQRETTARARQSELERERTELAIRRQVVEQHTRLQALGRQLELARNALAAADETARLSRQRRETGTAIVLEDLQAEEDLARARRELLQTVADYNLAQYALRYVVGD